MVYFSQSCGLTACGASAAVSEFIRGALRPGCAEWPRVCRGFSPFLLISCPAQALRRGRWLPEGVLPGESLSVQAFSKPLLASRLATACWPKHAVRPRPASVGGDCTRPWAPGSESGLTFCRSWHTAPDSDSPAWSYDRCVCVKSPADVSHILW